MRAAEIVDLNPAMTDAQQRPVAQAESSGGTVSLEALFAFKETVFRICLGHSRDYAEAEDLSQEVYLRAYRGLPDLREPSRAREWLFLTVKKGTGTGGFFSGGWRTNPPSWRIPSPTPTRRMSASGSSKRPSAVFRKKAWPTRR